MTKLASKELRVNILTIHVRPITPYANGDIISLIMVYNWKPYKCCYAVR